MLALLIVVRAMVFGYSALGSYVHAYFLLVNLFIVIGIVLIEILLELLLGWLYVIIFLNLLQGSFGVRDAFLQV